MTTPADRAETRDNLSTKRDRFQKLFNKIEAHHEGTAPLSNDEFDATIAARDKAWRTYQEASRNFSAGR